MGAISSERILSRLDEYLHKNDYKCAEKHLLYWLSEAENDCDFRVELLVRNELMGLYRKLGKKEQALECVNLAISKIDELEIAHQVGSATTYLNCATVYKAFDMAEKAIPVFEKARKIYETELNSTDTRLAGLYNNMALALVDIKKFSEAEELYKKAISVMGKSENGALEIAITYLNMASAKEAEIGLLEADELIQKYLEESQLLLDNYKNHDGHYAFVCEKCASVFGYYGHFSYEKELNERARKIYERS